MGRFVPVSKVGLLSYWRAVRRHWGALLTGVAVTYATLALSWLKWELTPFGWGLVVAVALVFAGYFAWRDERQKVEELTRRLSLRVSLSSLQDHRYDPNQHERCYLVLNNEGPGVAENVQIELNDVQPRPLYADFLHRFPQPVAFPVGEPVASAQYHAAAGRRINEGESASFPLIVLRRNDNGAFGVVGVDGVDTRSNGQAEHRWTAFALGERWDLHLRVSAANADPQEIVVTVEREGERLIARLASASDALTLPEPAASGSVALPPAEDDS